jgi:serine/threonine protein kinase
MSTQIGRFEILSEIAKSVRGGVFKANDPTSNQTVALKTVCLDIPEDQAKEFVERVLAEGEHTRELNSQNLALLYGAGQIEDQFCAAMEYVQGNSIATMLGPPRRLFDLGSTRHQPPGVRRTRSCQLDWRRPPQPRAREDHGAVGWPW